MLDSQFTFSYNALPTNVVSFHKITAINSEIIVKKFRVKMNEDK